MIATPSAPSDLIKSPILKPAARRGQFARAAGDDGRSVVLSGSSVVSGKPSGYFVIPMECVHPSGFYVAKQPVSIYEVHLESWMRGPNERVADAIASWPIKLVEYVKRMGYTHIELLPDHGASVFAARGAIRSPAISRPLRASARPTISAISSTAAIRPASA